MNRFLLYFSLFIILSACGTSEKDITKNSNFKNIFDKVEPISEEFNSNLKIELKKLTKGNPFLGNNTNNSGNSNFENNFKKIISYKFTSIDQFQLTQPELIFTNDSSTIFLMERDHYLKLMTN